MLLVLSRTTGQSLLEPLALELEDHLIPVGPLYIATFVLSILSVIMASIPCSGR
jgi:hypothetical protein